MGLLTFFRGGSSVFGHGRNSDLKWKPQQVMSMMMRKLSHSKVSGKYGTVHALPFEFDKVEAQNVFRNWMENDVDRISKVKAVQPVMVPFLNFAGDLKITADSQVGYDIEYQYDSKDLGKRQNLTRTDWYSRGDLRLEPITMHAPEQFNMMFYSGFKYHHRFVQEALGEPLTKFKEFEARKKPLNEIELPSTCKIHNFDANPGFAFAKIYRDLETFCAEKCGAFLFEKPELKFEKVEENGKWVSSICPATLQRPPDKIRLENLKWKIMNARLDSIMFLPAFACEYEYGEKVFTALINGFYWGHVGGVFGMSKAWQWNNQNTILKRHSDENKLWAKNTLWHKEFQRCLSGLGLDNTGAARPKQRRLEDWRRLDDFAILNLPRTSRLNKGLILKAFRAQAMLHHPDQNMNKGEDAIYDCNERFKRIQLAFKNLSSAVV